MIETISRLSHVLEQKIVELGSEYSFFVYQDTDNSLFFKIRFKHLRAGYDFFETKIPFTDIEKIIKNPSIVTKEVFRIEKK
jgi:hypothetical protein